MSVKKLAKKLRTPFLVQKYLNHFSYNKKDEIRSAEVTARSQTAHCFEAAILAAAILEHHGYPPLVVSIESKDDLDHVVFAFKEKGKWGAVAHSRDNGLRGRPPIYRSIRDLVWSYFDPYIDQTGRITAYQIANLDDSKTNWRSGKRNLWSTEQYLVYLKHIPLKSSEARYKKYYRRFLKNGMLPRRKAWW